MCTGIAGSILRSLSATIELSLPNVYADVEVDEVTFAKRAVDGGISWIQRGAPETLILLKLPERVTVKRAPGAGPLLLSDWLLIADKYLAGRDLVLNTDSARSYKRPIDAVIHTAVVHVWKKVNGVCPSKVRRKTQVTLEDGSTLELYKGTQLIVRSTMLLCHLSQPDIVESFVRLAQWRMWVEGKDAWAELARTLK
eukprot:4862504-Amphidinium_carterae.1